MTHLHAAFDALLFDLDGVVYVGPHAVSHAVEAIAEVRAEGARCSFVTNNASRPAGTVADHLTEIGVPCIASDVVTSPQAAVTVLGEWVPAGARVLVIGGAGIADELASRGYQPVWSLTDEPAAVMQGFSPDLGWKDLAEATFAVRAGLPWIATNPDRTFPTPRGAAPGNGALVAVVAEAAGRLPDAVAGKPEPPLLHEAIARLGSQRPLMIGDRLDTDIAAGSRIGISTLLVMSGVTTPRAVLSASPDERPTFLASDLRILTEGYPQVAWSPAQAGLDVVVSCRASSVTIDERLLVVTSLGEPDDTLRAACALMWAEADAGRVVEVPAETLALMGTGWGE
jgi:HAD superfamily hydrolase (TIGR01450 family)